uniref:G-protein coupled receptors family 1 profile domain-containing protein n=1 Tax=Fundulus heteroclitus TaxID=8078 RepID=A0A3Q2R4I7_FUNHE
TLLALFIFTLPVGMLGNVVVVTSCIGLRKNVKPSQVFLLNLALCDSAWLLTLPLTVYFKFQNPYPDSIQIFCKFKKISFNMNIYGSILFISLISFDRYVGAVHPISSRRWWNVGKAKICSVVTWVGLALSTIPDLSVILTMRIAENPTMCMNYINSPFRLLKIFSIIRIIVCFLLPFSATLAFYIMTIQVLRRHSRGRRNKEVKQQGRKPQLLIIATILASAASFVPYHTIAVTLIFMQTHSLVSLSNSSFLYASFELCEALCSLNSCLDPLLYVLASEQFKRKMLTLKRDRYRKLCCKRSRRVGVIGK